jgi:Zn-dependent peptidase ImmA (M78 family)
MTEGATPFSVEYVFREVVKIWTPAAEAIWLQSEMNVRSLGQTTAALERAGYEVYRADLPMAVSGCAAVVDGRRYIVVNRYESQARQQYTVSHELGHHVLHLNPSSPVEGLEPSDGIDKEFQADQFASIWLMWATKPEQRGDVLRRNPRASAVLSASVMLTVLIVAGSLLLYVCSRLFPGNPALRSENR